MNMNANTLNPSSPQAHAPANRGMQGFSSSQLQPVDDFVQYLADYARQNPGTTALWCFGLGFIVGWRLKPW